MIVLKSTQTSLFSLHSRGKNKHSEKIIKPSYLSLTSVSELGKHLDPGIPLVYIIAESSRKAITNHLTQQNCKWTDHLHSSQFKKTFDQSPPERSTAAQFSDASWHLCAKKLRKIKTGLQWDLRGPLKHCQLPLPLCSHRS